MKNVFLCRCECRSTSKITKKNQLVSPSRYEESTSFLNVDENNPPAFSCRCKIKLLLRKRCCISAAVKTTFRNNVLLRNFQGRRLKTSQPKKPSLVKIDSFFIAGTNFVQEKHSTKKIRLRHFVENVFRTGPPTS